MALRPSIFLAFVIAARMFVLHDVESLLAPLQAPSTVKLGLGVVLAILWGALARCATIGATAGRWVGRAPAGVGRGLAGWAAAGTGRAPAGAAMTTSAPVVTIAADRAAASALRFGLPVRTDNIARLPPRTASTSNVGSFK